MQYFINTESNMKLQIAIDTVLDTYNEINPYSLTPYDGTKHIQASKLDDRNGGCTVSLEASVVDYGGWTTDQEMASNWLNFMKNAK